ncbi:hypothetical protein Afil01_53580 [Actinorhabdospora filicis]|uniref:Uncharacterized protein n=1 Tax=Actinorhabdospora filicis TaxID=1785913 RepID=A0A9W6SQR5_9ACTN|nr:hypothetical protein [Actinorhabdospora filicis]GLZ80551.1 hypothetical protein Afil01_53580 [Actinorhabdospora filicis]
MVERDAFAGFADPVNPTREEVVAWAYDPAAGVPMSQDWDLMVAEDDIAPALVDLAADPVCPKRTFALHCLYIYAGDAVRTGFRAHPKRRLVKVLEVADTKGDPWVSLWVHNTRALIAEPGLFDYADWCDGGLARRPRRVK